MTTLGALSLVVCIFLAIVMGIYVGNLIRRRRDKKAGKMQKSRNRH